MINTDFVSVYEINVLCQKKLRSHSELFHWRDNDCWISSKECDKMQLYECYVKSACIIKKKGEEYDEEN